MSDCASSSRYSILYADEYVLLLLMHLIHYWLHFLSIGHNFDSDFLILENNEYI